MPIYNLSRHDRAFTPLCNAIHYYLEDKMIANTIKGGVKPFHDTGLLIKMENPGAKLFNAVIIVEIQHLAEVHGGSVEWHHHKRKSKYPWVIKIKTEKD